MKINKKKLNLMCKWNNHRLKCWKLIWYHWHSFLGINFRLQARTRMEKQILLQIAFGIVLKDLFTSKCDQTDNLSKTEQEFSTLARHAVYWKTRHSAIFFGPTRTGRISEKPTLVSSYQVGIWTPVYLCFITAVLSFI